MSAGGGVWFLHSQLGVLKFPPNAKEVVDLISTISYFRKGVSALRGGQGSVQFKLYKVI